MRRRNTGTQQIYDRQAGGVLPGQTISPALPAWQEGRNNGGQDILKAALDTGLVLTEKLAREYHDNEEARAAETLLNADREFEEWKAAYRQENQGGRAASAMRDFAAKYQEIADRHLENFDGGGEIYRDGLKRQLALRGLYAVRDGEAWQTQQTQAWQKSIYEGKISGLEKLIAENPEDPDRLNMAMRETQDFWEKMNPGLDPAANLSKLESMRDNGRMEALAARGDYGAMESLLEGKGRADIRGMPAHVEGLIRQAAQKYGFLETYGVADEILLALAMQESGGNQRSISHAGAIGVMQLMPGTAGEKRVDPYNLEQNIDGGARHFLEMLQHYNGDLRKALTAYNWGHGNLDAWLKTGRGMRGQAMPAQAREYAGRVLGRVKGQGLPGLSPKNAAHWRGVVNAEHERQRREAEAAAREAEAAAKREQALRREDMDLYLKNALPALENGEILKDVPTDDQLRAAYGNKWEDAKENLELAWRLGDDTRAMRGMTEAQQELLLNGRKPVAGEHYAKEEKYRARLESLIAKDREERKKDPGAYVIRYDEGAKNAFAAFMANANPESGGALIASIAAAKKMRGIESENILPDDFAKKQAQTLESAENPAQAVRAIAGLFQADSPAVMRQIFKKSAPLVMIAATVNPSDDGDARAMLKASRDPDFLETNKKFLTQKGDDPKDLEMKIMKKLENLSASFMAGGDTSIPGGLARGAFLLAMHYMNSRGMDMDEAAEKACDVLALSRYAAINENPDGSRYRVPEGVDPDLVQTGCRNFLDALTEKDIDLNLPVIFDSDLALKNRLDFVRGNARWVTAGDESGLILFLYNRALRDRNGALIQRSWKEIMENDRTANLTDSSDVDDLVREVSDKVHKTAK